MMSSSYRWPSRWLAVGIGAVALMLGAKPVWAVHDDGVFQVDGDALAADCGTAFPNASPPPDFLGCTGDDWDDLYTCAADGTLGCTKGTPGVGNSADVISDLVVDEAPASIFRGGGSKDEKDLTQWKGTDGAVPDKDDLIEAFAALYGDQLYFGANRLAVNGDAQIGFWFFQEDISFDEQSGTFVDSDGNPATHTLGDILILSNFVQGGGNANIQVYKVTAIGPVNPCPPNSFEVRAGAGDICVEQIVQGTEGANGVCNQLPAPGDDACAATNGEVVPALDPDFTPKAGAQTGEYPIVGFFEGGLDLGDLGLGSECFPVFLAETRSSQSITAVLKDFTLGRFQNCQAAIRTEIHSAADNSDQDLQGSSVQPGTTIHDLAIVTGTEGAAIPTGQVRFALFGNQNCTGSSTTQDVVLNDALPGCPTDATCANSTAITPSPGDLSYQATYLGDGLYDPIGPSLCEPLTVSKLESTIETHIFTTTSTTPSGCLVAPCEITDNFVDLSGNATVNVRDQAVVTRDIPQAGDPTPTGTVTFTRFQFSNCTGTSTTETLTLGTTANCPMNFPAAPAGGASGCSSVFALGPNTLGYKAIYSGDANYSASALSRCEPTCAIDMTK